MTTKARIVRHAAAAAASLAVAAATAAAVRWRAALDDPGPGPGPAPVVAPVRTRVVAPVVAPAVAPVVPPAVAPVVDAELTQAAVTDAHLERLGTIAARAHADVAQRRSDLDGTLVAAALTQDAAAHRVDPAAGIGVRDLEVWLFYARRPGVKPVAARGVVQTYDFGPSSLGRRPDAPEGFAGRTVDVLARTIDADGTDAAAAVRAWVEFSKNASPQQLRTRPVVLVWPVERAGEVVWPGPAESGL